MQQELATQITFYLGQTINLSLPTFFFLPYFKIIESTFYRQEQTFNEWNKLIIVPTFIQFKQFFESLTQIF